MLPADMSAVILKGAGYHAHLGYRKPCRGRFPARVIRITVPAATSIAGSHEENCPMRKTLIAAALFGFIAWAIVTFAMMVAKWTSQVRTESRSNVTHASHG